MNNRDAIKSLYNKYANDIYRYARLTLRDSTEAHDVVQEVFFRAFKSWHSFRHDASERTWLMSIARNYAFDLLRKRQSDREFVSNYTPPCLSDDQTRVETAIVIEEALSGLKETYQQVFILRHVQGLSVSDVAKILGWSQGKVRITDLRALTKLRERLSHGKEAFGQNEFKPQN